MNFIILIQGFRSNSHSSSNQTSSACDDVEISKENLLKRANVIKEIYKTEYDYLGHLKNLVDVSHFFCSVNLNQ